MAQLGADVEQLDQLARTFNEEAGKIQQAVSRISGQVNGVWWKGPDADRFRNEWEGTYRNQLQRIADELRQQATKVRNQAQQQRQTSAA